MLAMNDGRSVYHHYQPSNTPFYSPYSLKKEWQVRVHAMMDGANSNSNSKGLHSPSQPFPASTSGNPCGGNNNGGGGSQSTVKPLVDNSSSCPSPNSFNQSQSLKETVGLLLYCSREYGVAVRSEELRKLVELFIYQVFDSVSSQSTSRVGNVSPSPLTSTSSSSTLPSANFSQPLSAPASPASVSCLRCNHIVNAGEVTTAKTNVLIGSLVEKWWPTEIKVNHLRNEGNLLFEQKQLEQALGKYTEALNISSDDHLSLGNRSHALLTAGRSEEALQDAEAATKRCPTWPKSYFRKSAALISLGRYEEAFLSLTICMYLIKTTTKSKEDPGLSQVISGMMKIFHKIFLQSPATGSTLKRHTSEQSQFTPYPNGKKLNGRTDRRRQGYNSWNDFSEYNSSGDEADQSTYSSHPTGKSCSSWKSSSRINNHHHHYHHESNNNVSHHNHYNHSNITSNFSHSSSQLTEQLSVRLNRLFGRASQDLKCFELRLKGMSTGLRAASPDLISSNDLECNLCYRLLFQPVSTGCGHTFCRCCLERCMDHNPSCPLCKTSLLSQLANRDNSVTEFLESANRNFLPIEHEERMKQHLEELNAVPSAGKSLDADIPIFVCTMAFPTIPCPLHVFEPRYRLMIRRCMENGTNKFGMCCYAADGEHNYGDVGTLLEIRNIRYFADGRSVVDTMGCRRFRVLQKSMVDGYNAAKIELLQDKSIQAEDLPIVNKLHDKVFKEANEWLQSIGQIRRQRIHSHFGIMPTPTDDWIDSPDGPSWTWWLLAILPLDSKAQLAILSMCSLQKRLECILKVQNFVKNRINSMGGEDTHTQQQ